MDEIYHDESLGAHVNIALVRLIIVGYRQVSPCCLEWGRVDRQAGDHQIPLLEEAAGKGRHGGGAVIETSPIIVEQP